MSLIPANRGVAVPSPLSTEVTRLGEKGFVSNVILRSDERRRIWGGGAGHATLARYCSLQLRVLPPHQMLRGAQHDKIRSLWSKGSLKGERSGRSELRPYDGQEGEDDTIPVDNLSPIAREQTDVVPSPLSPEATRSPEAPLGALGERGEGRGEGNTTTTENPALAAPGQTTAVPSPLCGRGTEPALRFSKGRGGGRPFIHSWTNEHTP